jgi:hypothetical protein
MPRTEKERASITTVSRLGLFRKIIPVHAEDRAETADTLQAKRGYTER